MSEKEQSPAFDEQRLAKVLEAAYVLQEHNRERQEHATSHLEEPPGGDDREEDRNEDRGQRHGREHGKDGGGDLRPRSANRIAEPAQAGASIPAQSRNFSAAPSARQDFALVLAKIVETQQQIQAENLNRKEAMALIAERAMQIAQAAGAAIGVQGNGSLCYESAAGAMALAPGTAVRVEKALSSACLRIGQVIRCGSVNLEFLVDAEECARRGIESLIAAPIHHGGAIAGALELYYGEPQSFTEPDVHACQLMAGLAGEVLARSEGLASKKSLQVERAAMRDALEKLKPNLEALVEPPAFEIPSSRPTAPAPESLPRPQVPLARCGKCGNELHKDEVFCGTCGLPRNSELTSASMQSKVALLWQMQEQQNKSAVRIPMNGSPSRLDGFARGFEPSTPEETSPADMPELEELLAVPSLAAPADPLPPAEAVPALLEGNLALQVHTPEAASAEQSSLTITENAAVTAFPPPNWTSAAAAREFLERIAHDNRNNAVLRFLKARRGDVYLALAVILVACVIRWGVWSDGSTAGAGAPVTVSHHNPTADLSLFDRMLIKLGLADPPDPPVNQGNPLTQVWVDERTALYYCPGSDLYGKTPKGRMTTQRDAQLDQFEPASRKACN